MILEKDSTKALFYDWYDSCYGNVNKNMFEDFLELSSYRLKKTELPKISILDYKKKTLEVFKKRYDVEAPFFTDEELLSNRVKNEETGQKVTKVLNKLYVQKTGLNAQVLDYFHKPRYVNKKYYISGEMHDILKAYTEVHTCYSPNSENSGMIIQLLASSFTHVVFDENYESRMLVFLDHENKVAFFNDLYGNMDSMLTFSLGKFFQDNNYILLERITDYFYEMDRLIYIDNYRLNATVAYEYVSVFDFEEKDFDFHKTQPTVSIFKNPKQYSKNYDLLTGEINTFDATTDADILSCEDGIYFGEDFEYCDECGTVVPKNEYIEEEGFCINCADDYTYCEYCGKYLYEDNYNFEAEACAECVKKGLDLLLERGETNDC